MPYTATVEDMRDAYIAIRDRYGALERPRRWHSALLLAALARKGVIPEWTTWNIPPPTGTTFQMTSETVTVAREMFEMTTGSLLRDNAGGVIWRLSQNDAYGQLPARVLVDPFYTPPGAGRGGLCVVAGKYVLEVPLDDPSWLWNSEGSGKWSGVKPKEYKIQGSFGQQQGVTCAWPAEELFAMGSATASDTMSTPRPQCVHRRGGPNPANLDAKWPICLLNGEQCAAKGNNLPGPGGPRVVIPTKLGGRILVPDAIAIIVAASNPAGVTLPPRQALELITSWCHQGGGARISSTRVLHLISPAHFRELAA